MRLFSETLYRFLNIKSSPMSFAEKKVGIWHWDILKNLFFVNRFWYEKFGYSRIPRKKMELLLPLIHPDDIEGFNIAINEFLSRGCENEFNIEIRLKKSNGEWLWVYLNGKVIRYKKEIPARAEGIILDITRQKQVESELQIKNNEIETLYEESEAQNEEMASMMDELHRNQLELQDLNSMLTMSISKFSDIFNESPIGIIQSALDGRIISLNRSFSRTFGYDTPDELMADIKFTHEFYKNTPIRDELVALSETEKFIFRQSLKGKKKNGSVIYANIYLMKLKDKYTGEDYFTTFVEDITELKASQLERNLFFNNSGDLMLIHTIKGKIRQANSAWEDILGWTPDELKTMNLGDILHPDEIERTSEFGRQLKLTKTQMHITNRYRSKQGEYRIIQWTSIIFRDENLVFSSGRDETERFEAEQELQRIRDRLDLAIKSGTIGLWEFNLKKKSLFFNSNLSEIIGSDFIDNADEKWSNYIHHDDLPSSVKAMNDLIKGRKEYYIDEYRLKMPDGNYKWFFSRGKTVEYNSRGKPLRIAGSITDITEQKEAERQRLALEHQMLQAQKLESLGLLAGGIAHDFNNLLTGILGNADMLLYELPDHLPTQQKLLDIKKAAKKASELTKQMLAYSGRSTFSTEIIDVNLLVQEMSSLLDISISKKVKIVYNLTNELPCITGDTTQLSQIVMNLILNASESIENNGEIKITSYIKECESDEIESLTIKQEMNPGKYVILDISDTGCGIPQDKLKKIFDPFYTTKFTGRGLGLAAVSGIIRSHNAGLNVTSSLDEGTTFRIYLPVSDIQPLNQRVEEEKFIDLRNKLTTVLIADDESYIRSLTSKMLKTVGFDILMAENGIDAIEKFKNNISKIGCIILDLTMPEMDGHEALIELRKIDNKIPIIISSGYSEVDINLQFKGENISGFLQKPYLLDDLLKVIDKAIN